jgi:Fuc2NAc and GlcNAc transferase
MGGGIMAVEGAVILVGAFLASLALTGWVRRIALRKGMLDHPNERSSHSQPTPRGGGIAIVLSSLCAIAGLAALHRIDAALAASLILGGGLIAIMGFLDDRRSLSAGLRIFAHVAAASWAMYLAGGLPPMRIGQHSVSFGMGGNVAGVVAIVWTLNLFNFMDGIDGIAAAEAVFVSVAGGVLAIAFNHDRAVGYSAFAIAAAVFAFLRWNWPPAKIFMGDVGSSYLGYSIAVMALAAGRTSPAALFAWFILGSAFFADATITLLVRFMRRERVYLPHREHLYQRLALRWRGHRPVTLLVCALNVLVLLPAAVLAFVHQRLAAALAAAVFACLSLLIWRARRP